MPHIHTAPDQHDMTVSAYVIRMVDNEWKCLVHMHRKLGFLMQAGGHIEIDETPWQSVEHELREETGYLLDELSVLQVSKPHIIPGAVTHPTPFMVNTHTAGKGPHYHSDLCYAFIATDTPANTPLEGESEDLRWMTIQQMKTELDDRVLDDVIHIYDAIIEQCEKYMPLAASEFSLEKPKDHYNFS
jgi:8-oxo-dGTP pyrophosphatase MutT (NUDIX family)